MRRLGRPSLSDLFRTRLEADVEDELDFHIQRRLEAIRDSGVDADAARRRALAAFGDVRRIREACLAEYDDDPFRRAAHTALESARLAGATAILVLLAALADTFVWRPSETGSPDRARLIQTRYDGPNGHAHLGVSVPDWADLTGRVGAFDGAVVFEERDAWAAAGGRELPLRLTVSSPGFLDVFSLRPSVRASRRSPRPPSGEASAPEVVLSARWAASVFGTASAAGGVVRIDGADHVVSGVVTALPSAGEASDALVERPYDAAGRSRYWREFSAAVRLADGRSWPEAEAELNRVSEALAVEHPASNRYFRARIVPLGEEERSFARERVMPLLGIALVVWLGALARGAVRAAGAPRRGRARLPSRRELSPHRAVGSGLVGVLLGIGAGMACASSLISWLAPGRASLWTVGSIDPLAAGALLFGVAILRIGFPLAARSLRGRGDPRLRWPISFARGIALGLLLVACVAPLNRYLALSRDGVGYDPNGLTLTRIGPFEDGVDPSRRALEALRSAGSDPELRAPAIVDVWPRAGERTQLGLELEGRAAPPPGAIRAADVARVGGRYFEALGLEVVDGEIDPAIWAPSELSPRRRRTIAVNRAAVDALWDGRSPIGTGVRFGPGRARYVVAAVVEDLRSREVDAAAPPTVYVPFWDLPADQAYLVARGQTETSAPRAAAGERRPARAIVRAADRVREELGPWRALAWLGAALIPLISVGAVRSLRDGFLAGPALAAGLPLLAGSAAGVLAAPLLPGFPVEDLKAVAAWWAIPLALGCTTPLLALGLAARSVRRDRWRSDVFDAAP